MEALEDQIARLESKIDSIQITIDSLQYLQKQILTINEAATYTSLSKKYIYKLTSARRIPHYKRGKMLYFKKVELDEWMLAKRVVDVDEIERETNARFL